MIPGGRVNPRQMKLMMKRMGISTEEIEGVEEVVIRTADQEYVIRPAAVTVMTVQGQKTYQVVGEGEIRARTKEEGPAGGFVIPEEDVQLVVAQTGASEAEARQALRECDGQPAEAILKLRSAKR